MSLEKRALIEGVLFASTHPVSAKTLAEVLEFEVEDVKNIIGEMQEDYAQEQRGIWLTVVAGGYQLRTKPELKETMAKFYERKPPRLSQAMLETMAIIAYKQPVTRPEIDRIRGVDSSGVLKSLLDRELVEMRGRSESVGNPVLYATTPKFLEWFQINSLGDLPPLTEIEALNVMAEEGSENLLQLLNKDEGLSVEDLRDLDDTLLDVARTHRRIQLNEKEDNAEASAELGDSGSQVDVLPPSVESEPFLDSMQISPEDPSFQPRSL